MNLANPRPQIDDRDCDIKRYQDNSPKNQVAQIKIGQLTQILG